MEKRKAAGVIRSVWDWLSKRPIVLMIVAYLIFTILVIPDFYNARNIKSKSFLISLYIYRFVFSGLRNPLIRCLN